MFGNRQGIIAGLVLKILAITIGVVMLGNVVMPAIFGVNQTTWDSGTKGVWSTLGISAAAFGVMMFFS